MEAQRGEPSERAELSTAIRAEQAVSVVLDQRDIRTGRQHVGEAVELASDPRVVHTNDGLDRLVEGDPRRGPETIPSVVGSMSANRRLAPWARVGERSTRERERRNDHRVARPDIQQQ